MSSTLRDGSSLVAVGAARARRAAVRRLKRLVFKARWEWFRSPPYWARSDGLWILYTKGDSLVEQLSAGGRHEPETVRTMVSALPPGGVAVDVGSNIGLIAMAVARSCPSSVVHCFEPSPQPYEYCVRSVQRNGLSDRVVVNNCALYESRGRLPFVLHEQHRSVGNGLRDTGRGGRIVDVVEVETITLDEYADEKGLERIDVVKVDAEGAELAILRGSERVINELRPVIIFEAHPTNAAAYGVDTGELFAVLSRSGYRIFTLGGAEVREAATLVRLGGLGMILSRGRDLRSSRLCAPVVWGRA
ncbi:MAG: hypothetical protein KatS3mg060_0405 [Dehalococcoidia bacterium]|nr:MAG: hypothetical protein KatS3mg060_0405 [Dehalococcoidia bacterium]